MGGADAAIDQRLSYEAGQAKWSEILTKDSHDSPPAFCACMHGDQDKVVLRPNFGKVRAS